MRWRGKRVNACTEKATGKCTVFKSINVCKIWIWFTFQICVWFISCILSYENQNFISQCNLKHLQYLNLQWNVWNLPEFSHWLHWVHFLPLCMCENPWESCEDSSRLNNCDRRGSLTSDWQTFQDRMEVKHFVLLLCISLCSALCLDFSRARTHCTLVSSRANPPHLGDHLNIDLRKLDGFEMDIFDLNCALFQLKSQNENFNLPEILELLQRIRVKRKYLWLELNFSPSLTAASKLLRNQTFNLDVILDLGGRGNWIRGYTILNICLNRMSTQVPPYKRQPSACEVSFNSGWAIQLLPRSILRQETKWAIQLGLVWLLVATDLPRSPMRRSDGNRSRNYEGHLPEFRHGLGIQSQ